MYSDCIIWPLFMDKSRSSCLLGRTYIAWTFNLLEELVSGTQEYPLKMLQIGCNGVSLTWTYGESFQGPCPHCQPMINWCWFEILVGADLLPSTGFKMNFLIKWSAGVISKFIMRSLLFVVSLSGLGVSCSPWDPRFADSNLAEINGFLQDVKILSTSPLEGTLSWRSQVWDFSLVKEPQAWKNRPLSQI